MPSNRTATRQRRANIKRRLTLLRALLQLLGVIAVVAAYLWMSTDDFAQQERLEQGNYARADGQA